MNTVTLNLDPIIRLTDEQFYQLCMANKDVSLELNAEGELIIVPPVGGESGRSEADLNFQVSLWNYQTKLGIVFSSSTIFRLPNGAKRSPDVAWIKLERWEALTEEERKKFPPLTPDFIIELRSETDRLKTLQEKMQEYIDNGLRLGWLINPQDKEVEIYRSEKPVEIVQLSAVLSGEDVLPGFELQI
ncbi:Uma2 family endonuclease [Sphaerospermopsis sp. FACHB-1194]|uniref:Uma2 family endonuclease n=1 Tax=Sphaerospermopsis sp. FACHB-1194 TaxID=2692862 RepID=UPI00167FFBE3|nr:Uma2 family endonuclease [Sphaerospermopsis sp. FACHB-1194]MBD2146404.1 Uma2 family endonuclease [Sphaerospermopsis sp. FACHB-1194]